MRLLYLSYFASLRNFGNRIARIFTRKKDRHLESSKTVNERNQKATATSNVTAIDPKYATNPSNDASVTEEQFQKCTPKALNRTLPQNVDSLQERLEGETDHTQVHMEKKPKDINEFYNEMEQIVARQVRETIELADSRRGLLSTGVFIPTRKPVRDSEDKVKEKGRKEHETSPLLTTSLHNSTEYSMEELDGNNRVVQKEEVIIDDDVLKNEEKQKDYENVSQTTEETKHGVKDALRTVDHEKDTDFKERETQNVVNFEVFESTPNYFEQNSQIGFEHFAEPSINNPLNQQPEPLISFDVNKFELGQAALNIAQNAIRNTENIPEEKAYEATEIQNTLSNNPFELIEDVSIDLKKSGENALTLAENVARSYTTNPFESNDESSDEVEIRLTTKNPFDTIDPLEVRHLESEGLNVTQSVYSRNPFDIFDDEKEDIKQLGADALSITQIGATRVEAAKRQLSENAEDIDNVFDSLVEAEDLQKPLAQIGFDYLERTLEEQIRETTGRVTKNNQSSK